MASWTDFEAAAPELAATVRERLDAHTRSGLVIELWTPERGVRTIARS